MTRIAGIDLNDGWRVPYALTKIKGIGWSLSEKIIKELKISPSLRVKDLTGEQVAKLAGKLEDYPTEGELTRGVRSNIGRLISISAYRGIRHTKSLPVRGQRTKTNARTKRGKRKTVGAFKKEMLTKSAQKTQAEKE